ncbi:MAG: gliding motility-associated C-terminal domain-containing protein, partial [Bacteroidales bacterium]|nr:gliding motility-associated C-terminal domain-containing protein [Candidatus Colimorpha onthohippi]
DMLILKYAAVLEQPGHSSHEQPRFDFTIMDAEGREINPACNSAVFIPGYTQSAWRSYRSIMWKDWTTIGIDLDPLHGQTIYIRLTTKDCVFSAHYGYAYFVLRCTNKALTSSSCGYAIENTFYAPEGFNYKWFRTETPDSVLTTADSLKVYEQGSYTCHLSFAGGASGSAQCGFDLTAVAGPRFAFARYDNQITDTVNCLSRMQFYNNSIITNDPEHTVLTNLPCEEYEWFVDGELFSTDVNPYYDFEEGWHTVMLVARLSCGACTDTLTKRFYIGAACWVYDTVSYFFCDSVRQPLFDTVICDTGMFSRDSANHTHTLILSMYHTTYDTVMDTIPQNKLPYYRFNEVAFDSDMVDTTFRLVNHGNCDSLLRFSLMVCWNVDTTLYRVECADVLPLRWGDGEFNGSGSQWFQYSRYCRGDSNVTLNLHINPTYLNPFYDTICDNDWSLRSGQYFNTQGIHDVVLRTIDDCDSIERLYLQVDPTYDPVDRRVICSYDSLLWLDSVVYYRSTLSPYVHRLTMQGCDSNVHLHLIVQEPVVAVIGTYPNSASHDNREIQLYDYSLRSESRMWYMRDMDCTLPYGLCWQSLGSSNNTSFIYPADKERVEIMMISIDTLGCVDTAYRVITMERGIVWMPNVVTPELPSNNVVRVQGVDINEFVGYIYNRKGHLVCKLNSIQDVWDCTYKGEKCPQGAYVYILNYTTRYNPKSWLSKQGTFIIVR